MSRMAQPAKVLASVPAVAVPNYSAQRPFAIQAKPTVGAPDDRYEREADQVAEHVMRMPDPAAVTVASYATLNQHPRIQGLCAGCKEYVRRQVDEKGLLQPKMQQGHVSETTPEVTAQARSLNGGGQPLPGSARVFFESRFNHDFSRVRVHTEQHAADSAQALNANAYTLGHNIVFALGQYAPDTNAGKHLLAHELAHVVQQGGQTIKIQRRCGPAAVGPAPSGCSSVSRSAVGERFLFTVNCDDFAAGEEARLAAFAQTISSRADIRILGLASQEGPASFNESLSCHRANKGEAVLLREGITPAQIAVVEASGGVPPANDPNQRAVVIDLKFRLSKCGPEVSDWYIRQVTAATSDPAVLAIQADISAADVIARRHGTSARQVAEGGSAAAVVAQQARMSAVGTPAPPPTAVAAAQIAAGTTAGVTAASSLVRHPIDAATIGRRIGRAAISWAALVNHGARYDFKAHSMRSPTTSNCPGPECRNTITMCYGVGAENCYLTDLPGNLFYAQIGRFVGWSERTLQLGSQLAQLTGTGRWDCPQDTAAIHFGYALPIPMVSAALCSRSSGLPTVRGSLTSRSGCADCAEPTVASIR